MPSFLKSVFGWLLAGYPEGVPDVDYIPLFALLGSQLSEKNAGRRAEQLARAGLAVAVEARLVAARIRAEATDDWDDTVAADRFADAGGTLLRGSGRTTAPGEVTGHAESARLTVDQHAA